MTKVKESKLMRTLTNSNENIVKTRAVGIEEDVRIELTDLKNSLTKEKRVYEKKILDLTDLSPENSYSLRPGGADFDAKEWVNDITNANLKLELIQVKIDNVDAVINEWV